jgi:integrase
MSRARDRLTAVAVRNLVKPGFHHDGGGLYLQVSSYGTKSWVLRYTLNKKVRDMGLGPVADWTLAEARERAKKYRQLVDDGIDPVNFREQERLQRAAADAEAARLRRTFTECAQEYHEASKSDWKNAKHKEQWINTLTTYAFPVFGKVPISHLTKDQIRQALLPIWKTKAETASRVLQRIRTVVNYGAAIGYCNGLDSEQWDQLKKGLPKNSKELKGDHHASCPYDQVGAVLRTVMAGASSDSVKLAFAFIVLTAARSGEVRSVVWAEIDEKTRLWKIPEERMKAGRPHSVPLSDAALVVLEQAKKLQSTPSVGNLPPTGLIFPNTVKTALSDMTFTQMLRRMGVSHTMHGFRASFRTWGAEIAHYEHDILEFALAHVVGDATVRAYQRSDMVEKRRQLMQDWADYIRFTEDAELIKMAGKKKPTSAKKRISRSLSTQKDLSATSPKD